MTEPTKSQINEAGSIKRKVPYMLSEEKITAWLLADEDKLSPRASIFGDQKRKLELEADVLRKVLERN